MISIGNLQINKLCLGDVEVTKAYLGDVQVYGSTPQPVGKYMTITVDDAAGETVIKPTWNGTSSSKPNLQYSINNGKWKDFIVGTTADIHLTAGNFVQFRGNNQNGISTYWDYLNFVISGNPVALSGNVMSLIDGIGDALVVPCNYCFYKLFSQSSVKTVSSDFLPATTLKNYCYSWMFSECTSLTQAPELHTTTLANGCYDSMFSLCTALTTAPALSATTLAGGCYRQMFSGCTSLTTAPVLPATTLASSCYYSMFDGCTSLTAAPALNATTLADRCYSGMFRGCTSLTAAPALPATTLAESCYQAMFSGCTALTTASLPATTLASNCYTDMFYRCTALTTAPVLPATTLATECYYQMFCGSIKLNYVKSLATDITAKNALRDWLEGVSSTGTFVKPAGVKYPISNSGIPSGWTIVEEKPKPEGKYMTMTVLDGDAGTTIKPTVNGSLPNLNLQYRINSNGDWTNFIVGTTADIKVVAGDWVQFKGLNESGISTSDKNYMKFSISGNPVSLSGNVMSLIDGVGDALVIPNNYCFYKMFSQSNVKSVSVDFLPATTLTTWCYSDLFSESLLENMPELPALIMKDNCYRGMFYGCQNLTQAPSLPSTTLAPYCYMGMFQNCRGLTTAPALPAMTLKERCYHYMFYGCSSLNQAPALPATELAPYCYNNMFCLCTSLVTAPALPATQLVDYCYSYMFYDCSALVNAPALPATMIAPNCYRSMFYRCTALTQAPALPATTLVEGCYQFMFWGCSNLTQAPELPATELTQNCYNQMFCNCTSLAKAPELPATTLVEGCYQYMFYGDSSLNYVKSLATNITATNALTGWLSGVASSGTFVKPVGVSYSTGDSGIPSGWTVVEEKPKPEGKYMTITVLDGDAGTTIKPTIKGSLPNLNLQYRINSNGDWTNFIVGTTADIKVVSGDWVQFKGVNESGISDSTQNYLNFAISGNSVALSGNVMSLIDGIGETTVIPNSYCFNRLFIESNVKTVSPDFLPATTITEGCYYMMFDGCKELENAPELPATKLSKSCYAFMFDDCLKLSYMKCLARNITATDALKYWLLGVAQTGTFVKRSGVSYPSGISGIPKGWTIQNI